MIDKLELLLALAKERHFGRAAEACGVTQPTMSTSLKQLEEILGVMLVQRGSRFQGFTPEGERTLDWARRIVGDTRAMRQEINGLKDKLSGEIADRGDPDRARHGGFADDAVSRAASGCALPRRLLHLGRCAGIIGEPGGRCRADLYRERTAGQGSHHSALQRELPAADLAGCHVRRPRPGDLEGGRAGAAVPADPRHAEPPHHRSRAQIRRRRSDADADFQFAAGALHPCQDRTLGQRDAGQACRDARPVRHGAEHSDRRSRSSTTASGWWFRSAIR